MSDLNSRVIKRKRHRVGSQVTSLVERITTLVAERRLLARNGCTDRLEALDAEIDRLKWMLAGAARRELSEASAA
jgi:hypothetical protein